MKTSELNSVELRILDITYRSVEDNIRNGNLSQDDLDNMHISLESLTAEMPLTLETAVYLKDNPDGRLAGFLRSCHNYYAQQQRLHTAHLSEVTEEWNEAERKLAQQFLECEAWPICEPSEDHFNIIIADTQCLKAAICFDCFETDLTPECYDAFVGSIDLQKEDDGFLLSVELFSPLTNTVRPYTLKAQYVSCHYTVLDGMICRPISDQPWGRILNFFGEMVQKAETVGLNERESALLPLAREMLLMTDDEKFSRKNLRYSYPLIRQLLSRHDQNHDLKILDRIESHDTSSIRYSLAAETFFDALIEPRHYHVWKDVYDQICQSQREYARPQPVNYRSIADDILVRSGFEKRDDEWTALEKVRGWHQFHSRDLSDTVINQRVRFHLTSQQTDREIIFYCVSDRYIKENNSCLNQALFFTVPINELREFHYTLPPEGFEPESFRTFMNGLVKAIRYETITTQESNYLNYRGLTMEKHTLGQLLLTMTLFSLFFGIPFSLLFALITWLDEGLSDALLSLKIALILFLLLIPLGAIIWYAVEIIRQALFKKTANEK